MGSWDANDNFQSRKVHDANTPTDSMGIDNLTSCMNTNMGNNLDVNLFIGRMKPRSKSIHMTLLMKRCRMNLEKHPHIHMRH